MIEQVKNDKGYSILKMSKGEKNIIKEGCKCDNCITTDFKRGYYNLSTGKWYCPKCYNAWYKRAGQAVDTLELVLTELKLIDTAFN